RSRQRRPQHSQQHGGKRMVQLHSLSFCRSSIEIPPPSSIKQRELPFLNSDYGLLSFPASRSGESQMTQSAANVPLAPIATVARRPSLSPSSPPSSAPTSVAPSPIVSKRPFTRPCRHSGMVAWRRLFWWI